MRFRAILRKNIVILQSNQNIRKLCQILKNLERCDFIMKFRYYGKKTQNRLYKLTDFYTLFYLKYIEPNIDSFDEQWWSKHYLSHSVEAWQGLTFELLCLFHISQIRKALNIGGVASEAYIWCCQWHPFKYSKQRSHTKQSLSRMTHRRKRIFSSLKKRKKVDRVITTQPTLTTNIFSVNLCMIKPKTNVF